MYSTGTLVNNSILKDFHGALVVKNLPADAGDTSLIPDLGRFHIVTKQLSSGATANEA